MNAKRDRSVRSRFVSRTLAFAALVMCVAATVDGVQAQSSGGSSSLVQQLMQSATPQQLQLLQQHGFGAPGSQEATPQGVQSPSVLTPAQPAQTTSAPSSLEIAMSKRAGYALTQFGYDQLGVGNTVSVPQTGAVQDDYVLGVGDQIEVTLRGQESSDFTLTVDRNGQVILPKTGPIMAAGKTFGQFRQDLAAAVQRSYVVTQAFASIAQLRQATVMVAGEVAIPGMRVLTGLNNPLDAILLSGGVKKSGSLRTITLVRQGRTIPIDLYSVLTRNGGAALPNLQDGDRIVVPPIGGTVAIAGFVRRPGIYELAPHQTALRASELLSLGGGTMLRGATTVSLLKLMPNGTSTYTDISGQMSSAVHDGEVIVVKAAVDVAMGRIRLVGAVRTPGDFALGNYRTLRKMLPSVDALQPGAFVLFGAIDRVNPRTLQHELIAFSPLRVVQGEEDLPLVSEDTVYILTQSDVDDINSSTAALQLNSNNPLPSWLQPPKQAAGQQPAGTAQTGASFPAGPSAATSPTQPGFGQLPIPGAGVTGANTQPGVQPGVTAVMPVGAAPYMQGGVIPIIQGGTIQYVQTGAMPVVQPGAVPGVQAGAVPGVQPGAVPGVQPGVVPGVQPATIPGTQPGTTPNSPFQTSSAIPGQTGQMSVGQQLAAQFGSRLLDFQFSISGAVQNSGVYYAAPNTNLNDALAVAGGFSADVDRSSFEVSSTLIDNVRGSSTTVRKTYAATNEQLANLVIKPYDRIEFHHVYADRDSGTVTIEGEVRYPGNYNILRSERLSSVLMRAGGLTEVAYPYGTVFLRKSVADIETDNKKKAASDIRSALFAALVRPPTPNAPTPSADAIAGLQALLTQIESEPSLGRISIEADPAVLAAHPERDPILQPGDHIVIPKRPSSISVLGEVMRPGAFPVEHRMSADDYIDEAGGYTEFADEDRVIIVLPDGRARVSDSGWLPFGNDDLPPGTVIVVARDVTGLTFHQLILDTTQIASQLATTTAALAVLATRLN